MTQSQDYTKVCENLALNEDCGYMVTDSNLGDFSIDVIESIDFLKRFFKLS